MSHVDEGTLHAYLDGELSPPERAALEVHIAECTSCGARLAEERSLIERASAVLGGARPSERPAPPLSELASPRRRGRRILGARLPFAWAATVALALGIGYYLHAPESRIAPAQEPQAVAANVPAAERLEERDLQRRPHVRSVRSREEVATADKARIADSAGAFFSTHPSTTDAVAMQPSNRLRQAAPVRAPAPAAASALRLDEAVVRVDSVASLRGRLVSSQWTVISKGSARTLLGTDPVGIPGLAARAIRRSPTDAATIVVEQQLDSTTVIQLYQRAATVDGVALGYTAPSNAVGGRVPAERLARYVGGLRVEIAGPLTPDSLNRLLEQVQPLP